VEGAIRQRDDGGGSSFRPHQDTPSRNPDHPEPVFLQKFFPSLIMGRPVGHVVRDTVDLHDQACAQTAEVGDIGSDRMLAAELETAGALAKDLP
jgi:hypothetical protein